MFVRRLIPNSQDAPKVLTRNKSKNHCISKNVLNVARTIVFLHCTHFLKANYYFKVQNVNFWVSAQTVKQRTPAKRADMIKSPIARNFSHFKIYFLFSLIAGVYPQIQNCTELSSSMQKNLVGM